MSENNSLISNFQKNIDFKELFYETLNKWYILVSSIILAIVVAFVYSTVFITPKYNSTAKVIIIGQKAYSSLSEMELSSSTLLTKDFTEIINDKLILSEVAERLDNKYTASQIKGFITIRNPQDTRVIEITALTPDAKDSKKIVDTVCEVAQEKIVDLMGLDRITIISKGDVAKNSSAPNIVENILMSIVIGGIIGFAIITYIYVTSTKINSPEDIDKYVGISLLAVIPYNNKLANKNSK